MLFVFWWMSAYSFIGVVNCANSVRFMNIIFIRFCYFSYVLVMFVVVLFMDFVIVFFNNVNWMFGVMNCNVFKNCLSACITTDNRVMKFRFDCSVFCVLMWRNGIKFIILFILLNLSLDIVWSVKWVLILWSTTTTGFGFSSL